MRNAAADMWFLSGSDASLADDALTLKQRCTTDREAM